MSPSGPAGKSGHADLDKIFQRRGRDEATERGRGNAEQLTDPVTGCCGRDGLAVRIGIGRTRAVFKKHGDDPTLFVFRRCRARIAPARALNGEVQRGRTVLVHQLWSRTALDEGADRR
jgi:hypothetical protein